MIRYLWMEINEKTYDVFEKFGIFFIANNQ